MNIRYIPGIPEILTLIFVILKLTHYIDWSWFWVLSPILLVTVIFGIPVILIWSLVGLCIFAGYRIKEKK